MKPKSTIEIPKNYSREISSHQLIEIYNGCFDVGGTPKIKVDSLLTCNVFHLRLEEHPRKVEVTISAGVIEILVTMCDDVTVRRRIALGSHHDPNHVRAFYLKNDKDVRIVAPWHIDDRQ